MSEKRRMFMVEIRRSVLVMADDEEHAELVAGGIDESDFDGDPSIRIQFEVFCAGQLEARYRHAIPFADVPTGEDTAEQILMARSPEDT